jgi:hypothetical protein
MHGKTIALDDHNFTVDENTYHAIRRLVESGSICRECGKPYEVSNPKIHCNTCLACYLASSVCREKGYRFLSFRQYSDTYTLAQFITPIGYIHEISPERTDRYIAEPECDVWQTLLYWSYTLPFPYTDRLDGEYDSVNIHAGKPFEGVIVAQFYKRFGNGNSATYLLTNDGAPPFEINRRTKAARDFLDAATERAKRFQHSTVAYAMYIEMVKTRQEERLRSASK